MKIFGSVILILLCLTSCGTPPVQTTTTSFYVGEYKKSGTIAVVTGVTASNNSLEFEHYKMLIEQKLASVGYKISNNPASADYIAYATFGIDLGKNTVVAIPIYGQSSGESTYSSGATYETEFNTLYPGATYSMPAYSLAGSGSQSEAGYTRAIALDIAIATSIKAGHPKKVFESRANSIGMCGVFAAVFEPMLEAMFTDFPGVNGKPKTVQVKWDGGC